jgi:hypothetical protein
MKHIGFKHHRESKQNSDKSYKVYIIPQYITIYNTFIYVGAQITTTNYDEVQYHPYETIEV